MPTVLLSHFLDQKTPGYGGISGFTQKSVKSLSVGDSCNQSEYILNSHTGTYIDLPYHFDDLGSRLEAYQPEDWIFHKPAYIEFEALPGQLIEISDYMQQISIKDCDILLIKTGFENFRPEDKYWMENPGIQKNSALWLHNNIPQLRVIGFDFLSLTSYQQRSFTE